MGERRRPGSGVGVDDHEVIALDLDELGGPAGLGTVMIALTLGLSVSNGQRMAHYGFGRLRAATATIAVVPAAADDATATAVLAGAAA